MGHVEEKGAGLESGIEQATARGKVMPLGDAHRRLQDITQYMLQNDANPVLLREVTNIFRHPKKDQFGQNKNRG